MQNDDRGSLFEYLTGAKGVRIAAIVLLFVFGAAFMAQMAKAQEASEVPDVVVEEEQEPEASFWESWSMGWKKMFTDKEEIEHRLTQLQEYEQQLEDREEAIERIEKSLDFDQHSLVAKATAYRHLTLEHIDCSQETIDRLNELIQEVTEVRSEGGDDAAAE